MTSRQLGERVVSGAPAKDFTEKAENQKLMEIFTFVSFLPDQIWRLLQPRVSE